jgi:hypothetical protein
MSSDSELDEINSAEKTVARTDSKLRNSIETYGSNSYYYAHKKSKEFVVPADAIVVEGPGIITGGAPVKLSEGTPLQPSPSKIRKRVDKYAWCDEGDKVRIYIDDPNILPLITDSQEAVACSFDRQSMTLEVTESSSVVFVLEIQELAEEIDPSESQYRVSLGKRITVTLKKKDDKKWYSLKKK